jgi:hypothetical protein
MYRSVFLSVLEENMEQLKVQLKSTASIFKQILITFGGRITFLKTNIQFANPKRRLSH